MTILGLQRGRRRCGIRLCKTVKDLWRKITTLESHIEDIEEEATDLCKENEVLLC
jgi:hypothetical protein